MQCMHTNTRMTAALMPGGREDIPYLAKSSKLLYKAGWRDKPSSTHPESDCALGKHARGCGGRTMG